MYKNIPETDLKYPVDLSKNLNIQINWLILSFYWQIEW